MKLTEKDKEFLEALKVLLGERDLWIEKRTGAPGHFVLRGNYGAKIEKIFGMTRQGVRWRFAHLFNQIYVSAYTTILFVERNFGTSLRTGAMEIAKERFVLRQKAGRLNCHGGDKIAHKDED